MVVDLWKLLSTWIFFGVRFLPIFKIGMEDSLECGWCAMAAFFWTKDYSSAAAWLLLSCDQAHCHRLGGKNATFLLYTCHAWKHWIELIWNSAIQWLNFEAFASLFLKKKLPSHLIPNSMLSRRDHIGGEGISGGTKRKCTQHSIHLPWKTISCLRRVPILSRATTRLLSQTIGLPRSSSRRLIPEKKKLFAYSVHHCFGSICWSGPNNVNTICLLGPFLSRH